MVQDFLRKRILLRSSHVARVLQISQTELNDPLENEVYFIEDLVEDSEHVIIVWGLLFFFNDLNDKIPQISVVQIQVRQSF